MREQSVGFFILHSAQMIYIFFASTIFNALWEDRKIWFDSWNSWKQTSEHHKLKSASGCVIKMATNSVWTQSEPNRDTPWNTGRNEPWTTHRTALDNSVIVSLCWFKHASTYLPPFASFLTWITIKYKPLSTNKKTFTELLSKKIFIISA